ncbi:MAG: 2-oxoacid:acceptor oxidoreductase family protein [Oscillospiraceae bacterium]|nr:2-oxoacid:acceptor oxidoreductase family protein [Oscillospiraceae bacterium]
MERLIFSGFGGQGILTLGQVVAIMAMNKGENVTWMPSYGAEMRGGTANCSVIISDNLIGSPIVSNNITTLIAMNNPSFDKFIDRVSLDGNVIVNTSMVKNFKSDKVKIYEVDATNMASKLGNIKVQNMVMLGAYIGVLKNFSISDVEAVLVGKFLNKKNGDAMIKINMEAVKVGMDEVNN